VDLKALAEGGDVARFLYFYAPFRRAALDAAGSAPTLTSILAASEEYAHTVGEGLKGQVYDAVRLVAQGVLDLHAQRPGCGDRRSEGGLRQRLDHALPPPVRLLRGGACPPAVEESPAYRDSYSLRRIARDVAGKRERGEQLLPGTSRYRDRYAYRAGRDQPRIELCATYLRSA